MRDPSREPRPQAGAGSHGSQRLAVAPEALVGASAAEAMLGELYQLPKVAATAGHRRASSPVGSTVPRLSTQVLSMKPDRETSISAGCLVP